MPKAGLSQCQKNPVAGSAQVVCEKLAACRALDKGPVETVSSRQAAGSMDITEPKVNVSPKDESRGMHPTDGCDSRTVKSVEKHADSDSIASIDDDEDIYSGNGQSTSEERQDITEDPVSNHNEFTKKGVLDTKNIAGSLDSGDEQTKIRGSQADSTASEDIAASTSSSAPVDSHRSREPWQRWSKEKKQECKLMMKGHFGKARHTRMMLSNPVFKPWTYELYKSVGVHGTSLSTFSSENTDTFKTKKMIESSNLGSNWWVILSTYFPAN